MCNIFFFLQLEEIENNRNRIQQHCTSIENELSNIKLEYKKLNDTNELLKIKIEVSINLKQKMFMYI